MSLIKSASFLILLLATLVGCETTTNMKLQPAVLAEASVQHTAILNEAISKILNNRKVNLAPSAFTKTNTLILERMAVDPIGKQGMNGRLMERPMTPKFELFIQGENCYLKYEKTGEKTLVEGLVCKTM